MNISKRIITGIDIRCNSILAVTVAKKYDIYQIRMIQDISLKDNIEVKNIDSYHQVIVSELKKIKQKTSGSHYISLTLAESEVISKQVPVAATGAETYSQTALYQKFAKVIPLPIDELAIDYARDQSGYQVFATRKECVLVRQQIARDAGLKLGLIDTEKQAYLQSLCYLQRGCGDSKAMLIDVGAAQLRLGALFQQQTFYRVLDIPEPIQNQPGLLGEFVLAEWQKAISLHSELKLMTAILYVSPVYMPEQWQVLSSLLPCHCVDPATRLDPHCSDTFSTDAPFIAFGSALRAFLAVESNKYAA